MAGKNDTKKPGTWSKGQSGNPAGRPKPDPELKARCRDMTPKVLDRLESIIDDADHRDAVAACKIVLAYGHGNPTQPIEADLKGLSTDDLLKMLPTALEILQTKGGQ